MFEGRFGRKVTTALLALIGVAIATFSIRLVIEGLIVPLYGLMHELFVDHERFVEIVKGISIAPALSTSVLLLCGAYFGYILLFEIQRTAARRLLYRTGTPLLEKLRILFWIRNNQETVKDLLAHYQEHEENPSIFSDTWNEFLTILHNSTSTKPPASARPTPEPPAPPAPPAPPTPPTPPTAT